MLLIVIVGKEVLDAAGSPLSLRPQAVHEIELVPQHVRFAASLGMAMRAL